MGRGRGVRGGGGREGGGSAPSASPAVQSEAMAILLGVESNQAATR